MECTTIKYGSVDVWIEPLKCVCMHVEQISFDDSDSDSEWWLDQCGNHEIITLTLYLPKFLTLHVSTASRPTGYVTFDIESRNSGSSSTPTP